MASSLRYFGLRISDFFMFPFVERLYIISIVVQEITQVLELIMNTPIGQYLSLNLSMYNPRKPFLSQIGILAVRGCEIEGQVDKAGKLIPDEERFGLVPSKGVCDWFRVP